MPAFVWGPSLDEETCDGCRVCLEFCQQGVYGLVDDVVQVVKRDGCMPGCSHCAVLCEAGALSFPSLDELRASRARD